jgi:integrase
MRHGKRWIKSGTFATVIRAFMSPENPKWAAYAPASRDAFRRELELAERPETLGALPCDVIRPALVQAFLDGLSHLPAKQANARAALRAVEKWALRRDLLPFPITTGTEIVGVRGGHVPWTEAQMALGERHARPTIARAITLAGNTGQRGSDIVRMCPTDIHVYKGTAGINVRQQKTGRELWIPLTVPLQNAITTWERRPGPFITHPDGRPMTRKELSNLWTRERDNNPALAPLKEAGLHLHGLRGTAVVRLRRNGATESQIGAMIGMSIAVRGKAPRPCKYTAD